MAITYSINLGRVAPGPAGQRAEGRIVRVLDRAHPTVVGLFRYGPRGNFVLPYDTRIQHQVEIPPGDELTASLREKFAVADSKQAGRARRVGRIEELDGAVVNVELLRFPKGGIAPVGRVIEILGKPGDLGVDTEIIIRKHHLPHEFSARVLEEAERRAQPVQRVGFSKGAKIFASFRSSPSTERPRAISTTPCMWNGEPMAGGTCKCTSPT